MNKTGIQSKLLLTAVALLTLGFYTSAYGKQVVPPSPVLKVGDHLIMAAAVRPLRKAQRLHLAQPFPQHLIPPLPWILEPQVPSKSRAARPW